MLSTLARLVTGTILVFALVACPATPTGSVLSVGIDGGDRSVAVGGTLTLAGTIATTGTASASAGANDAYVRSYDADGTLRRTRQFGTSGVADAYGIATDANGNVYAAGSTDGALEGPNVGYNDAFIRKYGP